MTPALRIWDINQREKTCSVTWSTDKENEVSKRYVKTLFSLPAIAEVFKDEGNNEYKKKEFKGAVDFYTEGLEVNCKDDELNAKLYSNRATANFHLG